MLIYRAYKFRLYPSSEQEILINQTIGCSRYVYNYFLNRKDEYYKETKKNLSLKEIKGELVILKQSNPWLKDVDSLSLTNSLEDLDNAYTNFFEGRNHHPIFKKKGMQNKYKTSCIRSEYKGTKYQNIELDLVNKQIKLPKIGLVCIKGYRNLNKELKVINATIEKIANKYYVSVCCALEIEIPLLNIQHAIGLDLGVTSLITTTEGIKYPKLKIDRIAKHIEVLQQRLSRCVKNSKNYDKLKNKLTKLYQKIKNMRKFYIHEITSKIVKENDLIVCENLKTKSMIEKSKSKRLTKGIINACFSEIVRQLEYKTKWQNKKLIKINTYYPSSKLCSHCGTRNNINDLSIRNFECEYCHYTHDRDLNASLNILDEGIRIALNKGLFEV